MIRKRLAYFISALLECSSLSAGQSVFADSLLVAPSTSTGTNAIVSQQALFGDGANNVTFQCDLAASQLTPMAGDPINGIGFRLSANSSSIGATSYGIWNLELSSSLT